MNSQKTQTKSFYFLCEFLNNFYKKNTLKTIESGFYEKYTNQQPETNLLLTNNMSQPCEPITSVNGKNLTISIGETKVDQHNSVFNEETGKIEVSLKLSIAANVIEKEKVKNQKLITYTASNNMEKVEKLLKQNCDINVTDRFGDTALHEAARLDYTESANLLLTYGANINLQNNRGNTPLHYAVTLNSKKSIELLLAKGSDPTIKNKDGRTALEIAKSSCSNDIVSLIEKHTKPREIEQPKKEESPTETKSPAVEFTINGKSFSYNGPKEDFEFYVSKIIKILNQ